MHSKEKSLNDLKIIRQMMEDSSKFLSLSGLSGILAGCFALTGAAIAYFLILDGETHYYNEFIISLTSKTTGFIRIYLLLDALIVFTLAVVCAYYLSHRKAKKSKIKLWNKAAQKLSIEMITGLAIGGTFCLILIYQGDLRMVASATLIFYGLTLINIAKYTHRDIKYLGYTECTLGLLAGVFLNFGILFWSIGFGLFHIIYGIVMYLKYERCAD